MQFTSRLTRPSTKVTNFAQSLQQHISSVHQIMLELEEVALVVLALQKRRKRRITRMWVHHTVIARLTNGSFYTLYSELREDDKFFNYFRMSITSSLTSSALPMYFTGTCEVISEDISYSYEIFRRVLCGNLSCIMQSFTA
jgi:hypothetical protein